LGLEPRIILRSRLQKPQEIQEIHGGRLTKKLLTKKLITKKLLTTSPILESPLGLILLGMVADIFIENQ
jgi:hypothetical protein